MKHVPVLGPVYVQQRCLLLPITASRIIAPSYMHVSFHERVMGIIGNERQQPDWDKARE
jgi:hypothetical protein